MSPLLALFGSNGRADDVRSLAAGPAARINV
jgi:hypothetical protein